MYVCICNAINCRTVRQAAREGATSVAGLFKAVGKSPQCGRCFDTMRDLLAETHAPAANTPPDPPLMVAAE